MKKLITVLAILVSILLMPGQASAQETVETCVETTVYGGGVGVVCGVKTHTPINTALGDNSLALALVLLGASAGLLYLSKKIKVSTSRA